MIGAHSHTHNNWCTLTTLFLFWRNEKPNWKCCELHSGEESGISFCSLHRCPPHTQHQHKNCTPERLDYNECEGVCSVGTNMHQGFPHVTALPWPSGGYDVDASPTIAKRICQRSDWIDCLAQTDGRILILSPVQREQMNLRLCIFCSVPGCGQYALKDKTR